MHRKGSEGLAVGDATVFVLSLWITLAFRYAEIPPPSLFFDHLIPFTLLFISWIIVFFVTGLYEQNIIFVKKQIPEKLANAHLINIVIALIFFYAIPYFGIAPKTTLFLYLLVSSVFLVLWRILVYPKISNRKEFKAIIIGDGRDVSNLKKQFDNTEGKISGLTFLHKIDPAVLKNPSHVADLKKQINREGIEIIVIDLRDPEIEPFLDGIYDLVFLGIRFIDVRELYEFVFGQEPLDLLDEGWFIKHASFRPNFIYNTLKRFLDIVIAIPVVLVFFFIYPFVFVAVKIEDRGSIFFFQKRIGENNRLINIIKFRTMTFFGDKDIRTTKIGGFLRKTRINELPQVWNIIKGDMSFIGPRPELPHLVDFYNEQIPYYNVRHLLKPGLSGWAQVHHKTPPQTVEETREKLAYDLYYLKHRSIILDLEICLRTIKTLISRTGI